MKLEKLEALRGMAAIYVVLHHSVPHNLRLLDLNIGFLFRFGQESVILFFLLSGFVINYSFSNGSDKTFYTYFLKRLYRIYIPLFFVFILGFFVECFRAKQIVNVEAKSLLLNILMLQDVGSLKPNVIVEPYMNNTPLWSLSYEWWFYMIYFPLKKHVASDGIRDLLVYSISIFSALVYFFYPAFLPRLFMYISIWWFGVVLSNAYMYSSTIHFKTLLLPFLSIVIIAIINGIGVYEAVLSGTYKSIGVHPVLELRHHVFAIMAVVFALFWRSRKWVMFDKVVAPFLIFAPTSYVIYISHYYFVVDAHYFSALNNPTAEFWLYLFVMLAFSYSLEVLVYPVVRSYLLNITTLSNRSLRSSD